jgi:ABC-type sulfate/molybdate transport systems ATPase subunit
MTDKTSLSIDVRFRRAAFNLESRLDLPGKGVTALLGASGSGKTTLLRLVAGLEAPHDGHIRFGDSYWAHVAQRIFLSPQQRRIGMVFQDFALFEHMTVAENIAYGVPRRERRAAVAEWVARLQLDGLADRYPGKLSGGQRQRVALARALAPEPGVLLLDEPFSAIDVHLRAKLRAQLAGLVAAMDIPVILVTHDLDEARSLADHVGVMADGAVLRFDAADAVFDHPGCVAAAKVLGWRNLLPLDAVLGNAVCGSWGTLDMDRSARGGTTHVGIRPECLVIAPDKGTGLEGRVVRVTELGPVRELQCRLTDGTPLYLHRPWNEPVPAPGSRLTISFPPQHVRFLGAACPVTGVADSTALVGGES